MLQFRRKAILLVFSFSLLLFFLSCERKELIVDSDSSKLPVSDLKIDYAYDKQIGLSWNDADYDGFYYLYKVEDEDSLVKNNFLKVTRDRFVDIEVGDYDTKYFFAVAKFLDGDFGEFSNIVSTNAENIYRPNAPSIFKSVSNNFDSLFIYIDWTFREIDIAFSKIYRNETGNFEYTENELIGKINGYTFFDVDDFVIGKNYYYSIILFDDGGLEGSPSIPFSNFCIDKPEIIYPPDEAEIGINDTIIYKTSSYNLQHQIRITSENPISNVDETIFYYPESEFEIVKIPLDNYRMISGITYECYVVAGETDYSPKHNQLSKTKTHRFKIK